MKLTKSNLCYPTRDYMRYLAGHFFNDYCTDHGIRLPKPFTFTVTCAKYRKSVAGLYVPHRDIKMRRSAKPGSLIVRLGRVEWVYSKKMFAKHFHLDKDLHERDVREVMECKKLTEKRFRSHFEKPVY